MENRLIADNQVIATDSYSHYKACYARLNGDVCWIADSKVGILKNNISIFDGQRIMNSFSLVQNRTLWSTLFTKQKFNILLFKVQGHNRKTFIPNQVNCFNFWYRAHLKRPTSEYLIWSIADMIMLRTMQLGDTILCSTFIRQTKMEIVQTACRKTIYDHLWRLFKYKVSFKGFCTRRLPQFSAIAA